MISNEHLIETLKFYFSRSVCKSSKILSPFVVKRDLQTNTHTTVTNIGSEKVKFVRELRNINWTRRRSIFQGVLTAYHI